MEILLKSIVFSTSYLNETVSKSDVFDSRFFEIGYPLAYLPLQTPYPRCFASAEKSRPIGCRDIMLPGARRGRLKIEQANHRADFAPHKLSRRGRAILLAKRRHDDSRRRLCSWIMTVQWRCNTLVIALWYPSRPPIHSIYAGVSFDIILHFWHRTTVEIYDRTCLEVEEIPWDQDRYLRYVMSNSLLFVFEDDWEPCFIVTREDKREKGRRVSPCPFRRWETVFELCKL